MIIEKATDKGWILASGLIAVAGTASYIWYSNTAVSGPSGASWPGLIYGIIGTAMMAFAGLLGARKKAPTLHIGRVQAWMRGHVWLGLVSFPIILFHGGFSMGGGLTFALMILFAIIVLSGILGVVLQQFMPRLMMEQVSTEIVYEQADMKLEELIEKAAKRVESLKPKADAADTLRYDIVKDFYNQHVVPFLKDPKHEGLLATTQRTRLLFEHVGKQIPPASHPVIDDLQKIVQQRRDLATQVKLHQVLHLWLLVHVPLSAAVLVLTIAHALMALRYS